MTHPPFLRLPLELRDKIYGHLLPNEEDICIAPGFIHDVYHEGDMQWVEELFDPRKGGDSCHTAILAVNKQINAEASRVMYSRTFTIGVSGTSISFLQDHYRTKERTNHGEYLNVWEHFPTSFPFHRIRALRIQVTTPQSRDCEGLWVSLKEHIEEVRLALRLINYNVLPLKKLIIDAWEPNAYHGPIDGEPMALTDIRHLFRPLQYSIQNVSSCEIRLQGWAKTCPRTIELAKDCGRAIMTRPRFGEKSSTGMGTGISSAARPRQEAEPVVLIREMIIDEPEFGTICTSWGTVCTRL